MEVIISLKRDKIQSILKNVLKKVFVSPGSLSGGTLPVNVDQTINIKGDNLEITFTDSTGEHATGVLTQPTVLYFKAGNGAAGTYYTYDTNRTILGR